MPTPSPSRPADDAHGHATTADGHGDGARQPLRPRVAAGDDHSADRSWPSARRWSACLRADGLVRASPRTHPRLSGPPSPRHGPHAAEHAPGLRHDGRRARWPGWLGAGPGLRALRPSEPLPRADRRSGSGRSTWPRSTSSGSTSFYDQRSIVWPTKGSWARSTAEFLDKFLVDGLVRAGRLGSPAGGPRFLGPLQNGLVQYYAAVTALSVGVPPDRPPVRWSEFRTAEPIRHETRCGIRPSPDAERRGPAMAFLLVLTVLLPMVGSVILLLDAPSSPRGRRGRWPWRSPWRRWR